MNWYLKFSFIARRIALWGIIAVSACLFTACSKSDPENPDPQPQPQETITFSPGTNTTPVLGTTGGSASVTFTTSASWSASVINTRASDWCSVSPTSGGAGTATITITASENTTPDNRAASVTIKSGNATQTIKVEQKQKDALTVSQSSFEVPAAGQEIKVVAKANVSFTYTISEDARTWIKPVGTKALKESVLTFEISANSDLEHRTGEIYLSSGNLKDTVKVYQAGAVPSIVISQEEYVLKSEGESFEVEVASNVDAIMNIVFPDGTQPWFAENKTKAMSTNKYVFTAQANEAYDSRSAMIIFANVENNLSDTVRVIQMQKDAIVLAKSEYEFGYEGGELDFEVQTNVDIAVSISDNSSSWIRQVETRALETKKLHFNISACDTLTNNREGYITLSGGNASQTIKVTQTGLNQILEAERQALIAFYKAAGGDNWKNNTNWCSDKSIEDWHGITTERGRVTSIDLPDNNLSGKINGELNKLANLFNFDFANNNLESINVSGHPTLQSFICSGNNQLQVLNVSNCASLKLIICYECNISNLNITGSNQLEDVICHHNNITELDISNMNMLKQLICDYNKMESLEIGNKEKMEYLWCSFNNLSKIDVSGCPNLRSFIVRENLNLTEITFGSLPKLDYFDALGCNLHSLNLEGTPNLRTLRCPYNRIESLDVSHCTKLEEFWCYFNELKELDVSKCTDLVIFKCFANKLTSLDVTNCQKIEILDCSFNSMLDLKLDNPKLEYLICSYSGMSALELSKCPKLIEVWCGNEDPGTFENPYPHYGNLNKLSAINLSQLPALTAFSCLNMHINSLDISNNPQLEIVQYTGNPVGNVDFTNNSKLENIYAFNVGTTGIDLSHVPNLKFLGCGINDISSLNLSANPKLEELWCAFTLQQTLDVSYNSNLSLLSATNNPNLTKIIISENQQFTSIVDPDVEFVLKGSDDDTGGSDENPESPFDIYESADYSQDGKVYKLQTATSGNGIDIVLMGDGFSDRQIADGTYAEVMNAAMENFFAVEPYRSFRDKFNVYSVVAVSKNEGYTTGYEQTAFSCYFGSGTNVGGEDWRVFDYSRKAVEDEKLNSTLIMVIMNSTNYAGTCYMYSPYSSGTLVPEIDDYSNGASIAYFPIGTDYNAMGEVLQHEANGHGFAKLQDEYYYDFNGSIPEFQIELFNLATQLGWYKNVDLTGDPNEVKWAKFLQDNRYNNDGLGVFEGGATFIYGVWRPTENSIMRYNTGVFNAPSREAIYYRIHKLAYGDDWKYDYEKFVEYDAINRGKTTQDYAAHNVLHNRTPLHPPVFMNYSWKDACKKAYQKADKQKSVKMRQKVSPQESDAQVVTIKPTYTGGSAGSRSRSQK